MPAGRVSEIWRYPVKSMGGEQLERSEVGTNGLWGDRAWAVVDVATGEIHNAKRFPILMQCATTYRRAPSPGDIPEVEITLPDGARLSSDSPLLPDRLSELMRHRVSLEKLRPATDTGFYRRRDAGTALIGRVARFRQGRRVLAWALRRGLAGGTVREDFARQAGEPLPDLSDAPSEAFEFYTPPGTFFDLFPIHVLTTSALASMRRLNPAGDWNARRFRPNLLVETAVESTGQVEQGWLGQRVRVGRFTIKGELPTVRCAMPTHAQPALAADPSVLRTIVREADQCLGLYASVSEPGAVAIGEAVEPDTHE